MNLIGVTMRVDTHKDYGERRDALDQQWTNFLLLCGLIPVFMPNSLSVVKSYLQLIDFSGFLLSGGNSPTKYLGDAPERDEVDAYLIDWSLNQDKPLIGVCRGMQSIQMFFEQALLPVEGHVLAEQEITINGQKKIVNSYHRLGANHCTAPLTSWAKSKDGIIKAIQHENQHLYGIMWHPERNTPFKEEDIQFFKRVYQQ